MAVRLRVLLIITGLTGIHSSIKTVSEVSVKAGGSVSIPCLYGSQYSNHVKYLCKGYRWSSCSYEVKTYQRNSGRFSISDDKTQSIFTVTIKNLTSEDANYWCAVEINGGADDGAYFYLSITRGIPSLYVDHQEITGFIGDNITINCHYSIPGEMKWCRVGDSCVTKSSESIDGTRVTINASVPKVFTVTMSGLRTQSSGWYWCVKGPLQMPVHLTVTEKTTTDRAPTTVPGEQHSVSVDLKRFIIPLSVLIFIVMMTLSIWCMLKRHKQTKAAASVTTAEDKELTYITVDHKRKTSKKSHADHDVDVTYSSVVTTRQQRARQIEANDENVTYSLSA